MKYIFSIILLSLVSIITTYSQKSLVWQGGKTSYQEVIKIANIDGTNIQDLYDLTLKEPEIIAIDRTNNRLFWYDRDLERVMSCDLYGNNIEEIFNSDDSLVTPQGISIDEINEKIYITEYSPSRIFRSNFDGSQKEYLYFNHLSAPTDMVIDASHEKLYWLEGSGLQRFRVCAASLHSDTVAILIDTTFGYSSPQSIALDKIHNKLYLVLLSNSTDDKIMRSNIDGSELEEIINSSEGLIFPTGITVDNFNEKIYWTDSDANGGGIFSADLDGENIAMIDTMFGGYGIPSDIEYLEIDNKIYWADVHKGIFNKGASNLLKDTLIVSNYLDPTSLTYNSKDSKIYWADILMNTISRGDFHNSIEHLIGEEEYGPDGLVIDTIGNKMYWNIQYTREIKRSNLDGSEKELFLNLQSYPTPYHIGLDSENRMLYWTTNTNTSDIYRSNIELINDISLFINDAGGGGIWNIEIDNIHNKIYWSDSNPVRIRAADLNGQNVSTIISEEDSIQHISGLTLDPLGEKLYWSDGIKNKIQRSDLYGNNIEDIISEGLNSVSNLIIVNEIISDTTHQQNINHSYNISQNYPNPFNPRTKINYSIPQTSFITIKVYDLLGREITTLVEEEKTIGNYQTEFNGSNLSSGVYFYKMQTGDFTVTKKLILIK